MIPRYSRPEMAALWSDQAKFQRWLAVEVAACEAWAELARPTSSGNSMEAPSSTLLRWKLRK